MPRLEKLTHTNEHTAVKDKSSGRGPLCKNVDEEVFSWYEECRNQGKRPKSGQVQGKAKELYKVWFTHMVYQVLLKNYGACDQLEEKYPFLFLVTVNLSLPLPI